MNKKEMTPAMREALILRIKKNATENQEYKNHVESQLAKNKQLTDKPKMNWTDVDKLTKHQRGMLMFQMEKQKRNNQIANERIAEKVKSSTENADNIDDVKEYRIDIIAVIASIVKQAVEAGFHVDEAINKTVEHFQKTIDLDSDTIDRVKEKLNPKKEHTNKSDIEYHFEIPEPKNKRGKDIIQKELNKDYVRQEDEEDFDYNFELPEPKIRRSKEVIQKELNDILKDMNADFDKLKRDNMD